MEFAQSLIVKETQSEKQMFNPPHPGPILREDVLPVMNLSVTAAAAELKISRVAFSRILNEHAAVSAAMALRLADWLAGWLAGDPNTWLRMQSEHDLWKAKKGRRIKIKQAQFVQSESCQGKSEGYGK